VSALGQEREIAPTWASPELTARQRSFRDAMLSVVDWSLDDLQAAVDALPAHVRARLSQGPVARRWSCGICDAFSPTPDDMSDPIWKVYAYHEVPKLYMRHRDEQWYGLLADEVWERCRAVYKAAGWSETEPGDA
jgi:hypothetical protein